MKLLTTPPRGARLVREYSEQQYVSDVERDAELTAALGHVPVIVANGRYSLYVDDTTRFSCTPLGTAVALQAELEGPALETIPTDAEGLE